MINARIASNAEIMRVRTGIECGSEMAGNGASRVDGRRHGVPGDDVLERKLGACVLLRLLAHLDELEKPFIRLRRARNKEGRRGAVGQQKAYKQCDRSPKPGKDCNVKRSNEYIH